MIHLCVFLFTCSAGAPRTPPHFQTSVVSIFPSSLRPPSLPSPPAWAPQHLPSLTRRETLFVWHEGGP